MSILVYPDINYTEWISWKKLTRKIGKKENLHFRWTSERSSDYSTTLPSLSISPLSISHKPVRTAFKTSSTFTNPMLFAQLPHFTGSIKARNTAMLTSRLKHNKDFSRSFNNLSSELIPKSIFFQLKKQKSRVKILKNVRKFEKLTTRNQKLEGITGKRLVRDTFFDFDTQFKIP